MKQDGYWTRIDQEKADAFAEHLIMFFTPNNREIGFGEEKAVFGHRRGAINILPNG
jgi:hypothetical protein